MMDDEGGIEITIENEVVEEEEGEEEDIEGHIYHQNIPEVTIFSAAYYQINLQYLIIIHS